jgi:hypothetical protein
VPSAPVTRPSTPEPLPAPPRGTQPPAADLPAPPPSAAGASTRGVRRTTPPPPPPGKRTGATKPPPLADVASAPVPATEPLAKAPPVDDSALREFDAVVDAATRQVDLAALAAADAALAGKRPAEPDFDAGAATRVSSPEVLGALPEDAALPLPEPLARATASLDIDDLQAESLAALSSEHERPAAALDEDSDAVPVDEGALLEVEPDDETTGLLAVTPAPRRVEPDRAEDDASLDDLQAALDAALRVEPEAAPPEPDLPPTPQPKPGTVPPSGAKPGTVPPEGEPGGGKKKGFLSRVFKGKS